MKTWVHAVSSLILAALLFPVFSWKAAIILISGVLIDIDHYFWYVYKYRKFNIFQAYGFFLRKMETKDFSENIGALIIFHTLEFLLITLALSFYSNLVLIFAIGLLLHYLLDAIYLYSVPKRLIADHSAIHWVYRNTRENQ